jgi:preprotein translocase subunit YajC
LSNPGLIIVHLLLFQSGIGGLGSALLPMLLIFGVFYLLLIRPQQKKQRELQAAIAELKAGDKVITTGGIVGVITAVRETSFLIRSAEKTILEIARSAVAGVDQDEKK